MRAMRVMRARAGLAAAGGFVLMGAGVAAWLPAAATGTAASARGCSARQLSVAMTHITGSDAAGNTEYALRIHNVGGACRLGNHPNLRLVGTGGKTLPTHVTREGKNGVVTIPGGKTRGAILRFSPDVPGPGEPTYSRCEPVAHQVKVQLASPGHGSIIGPVRPPTSVCEHGSLGEGAL